MQLKASTDYGMRAILYLAAQGTTCSSKDIAQDMSIPRDYLIQLAQLLRNAGIIEARPGKHGGYRLAKDPADIERAADHGGARRRCKAVHPRQARSPARAAPWCRSVKQTYELIEESFDAYLDSLTVADAARLRSGTATTAARFPGRTTGGRKPSRLARERLAPK